MYNTLSGAEISKRIIAGDVLCVLAHALYQDIFGKDRSLANASDSMRFNHLEKAQHVIDHMLEHNLVIMHKKTDG